VAPENSDAKKTEELAELLRAVRERVSARYPSANGTAAPHLADLTPLTQARDAAEAKIAAIGTVNPRPSGPLNAIIQTLKRAMARGLGWFVRDQIVFNREVMACVESTIQALNDINRAVVALNQRLDSVAHSAEELKDIRSHWTNWRSEWEHKLATNEVQFLRSVADLQTAFQHRATLMESNFRENLKSQHADYLGALDRATLQMQKQLAHDFSEASAQIHALIHTELRLVRQRTNSLLAPSPQRLAPSVAEAPASLDYSAFARRFRGSEEFVKSGQRFYLSFFAECKDVLDIGCGRGEFLDLLREGGIHGLGIDRNPESVGLCRSKGLRAEQADLFDYLAAQPPSSLDGIFCAQVVEHLPPAQIPDLIRLAARALRSRGVLVIETPNPECLAIFATHFYLDPTHLRPVPHQLLAFYMEECGLGQVEVHRRSPAVESTPALASIPADFRDTFFGALDYGIVGKKLV